MAGEMKPNLSVTVGRLVLKNPLIIVSGVFGYGEEFRRLADFDPAEAGAVVLKGITLKPWHGNPPPRIVETAAGMLNSIGLQNIGVEKLVTDKLPLWENIDTKVIINVAGNSVEEYLEVVRVVASSPVVAAVELNLSCPNVAHGGLAFGVDPNMVATITARARQIVPDKDLWVKLTPNVDQIEPIARAAIESGADAISLINTLRGMAIDVTTRKPVLSNNIGGLSGPAIKPVALLKVAEAYRELRKRSLAASLIGIGGVMDGTDVIEFMIAGASAVGIGTTLFYDPLAIRRILGELNTYLQKTAAKTGNESDANISSLIGTLEWNIPTIRR